MHVAVALRQLPLWLAQGSACTAAGPSVKVVPELSKLKNHDCEELVETAPKTLDVFIR